MKRIILTSIFALFTVIVTAQKCNCNQYYNWLKQTFEQNDAGFTYTRAKKGQESYDRHNKFIFEKASQTNDLKECVSVLKEWLSFFRKFHTGLLINSPDTADSINLNFPLPAKSDKELTSFVHAMSKKPVASVEGIYQTGSYKILVTKEKENFIGYILQSTNDNWKKGEAKFSIQQDVKKAVYLMGDHTVQNINSITLIENKYLLLDDIALEKEVPAVKLATEKELYYQAKFAENPFIKKLKDETIFIRLPSFESDQKASIDSLLTKWKDEILKSKNLIIDIRDNGGGADKTYAAILPFIYTNPIHRNQIEFYSSALNNKKWFEILQTPDLSANEKRLFSDFTNRLNKNTGGFEKIYNENISVIKFDTVYKDPKSVAVITNEKTASAAEQFILDLKQSWKVKTFGHQTAGAIDIANVTTTNSPDNKLMLVYATSRFVTVNKLTIDGVGILPDFYIDDTVGDDEWIAFIVERMKQY